MTMKPVSYPVNSEQYVLSPNAFGCGKVAEWKDGPFPMDRWDNSLPSRTEARPLVKFALMIFDQVGNKHQMQSKETDRP